MTEPDVKFNYGWKRLLFSHIFHLVFFSDNKGNTCFFLFVFFRHKHYIYTGTKEKGP